MIANKKSLSSSKALSDYAERKKESMERANKLRQERNAKEYNSGPIKSSGISARRSGDDSNGSAITYPIGGSIIQREVLPQMPSLAERFIPEDLKNPTVLQTRIYNPVTVSFSANARSSIIGGSVFLSPPSDPAGFQYDLSDRPTVCSAMNAERLELVFGSSDHALYSVGLNGPKRKITKLYSKKYGHTDWVTGCSYLPNHRIVSCGMDGKICYWSLDKRKCDDLIGHEGSVSKVICDQTYNVCFSCGYDKRILGWNLDSSISNPALEFCGHEAPVLEICHQSNFLISGARDGSVFLWDVYSGELLNRYKAHPGQPTFLQFLGPSINGSSVNSSGIFVSAGTDGFVKLFDPRERNSVLRVAAHCDKRRNVSAAVSCVDILSSSSTAAAQHCRLVTGGADSTVRIFDLRLTPLDSSKTTSASEGSTMPISSWSHSRNSVYSVTAVGEDCVFTGDGVGMLFCYNVLSGALCYGIGASQNSAVKSIHALGANKVVAAGEDGKALLFEYSV